MLQPFLRFRQMYMHRLIELEKFYLISQSYNRGNDHFADTPKTGLLMTDYNDIGLAKTHLNAIKHDKYAALLDLTRTAHKKKLIELLSADSKYAVYWAVIKSAEELQLRVNRKYKDHMRRYIESRTDWRIGRETTLRPVIQLKFGEIYVTLKFGNRRLQVKFEEIEKA
jgi:hypothetical protein